MDITFILFISFILMVVVGIYLLTYNDPPRPVAKIVTSKPKALIIQSTKSKTIDEIRFEYDHVTKILEDRGYYVVLPDVEKQSHSEAISKSVKTMSMCDAIYFCPGWEEDEYTNIEHRIATFLGCNIIYK